MQKLNIIFYKLEEDGLYSFMFINYEETLKDNEQIIKSVNWVEISKNQKIDLESFNSKMKEWTEDLYIYKLDLFQHQYIKKIFKILAKSNVEEKNIMDIYNLIMKYKDLLNEENIKKLKNDINKLTKSYNSQSKSGKVEIVNNKDWININLYAPINKKFTIFRLMVGI